MSSLRRSTPPPVRPDVERELGFHLDMRIRELIEQGMPEEQARRHAMEQFGDYRDSERACVAIDEERDRRRSRLAIVREFWHDVAYAVRVLRRSPGFTAVAILTLALGIGANSAIFSVVNGVLLESLPYPDANRLFSVRTVYPDGTPYSLSAPDFMSVRENARVFDQVESFSTTALTMTGVGEPRELQIAQVSDGVPALMGWRLSRGRIFERADFAPGKGSVLVLDHGFWQRAFGGDTDVLGRTLVLAGRPAIVIGVLAPDVRLPSSAVDAYAPLEYDDTFSASTAKNRRGEFLTVIGHAKPNADVVAIGKDLRRLGTDLQAVFKATNEGLTFGAIPLAETIVGNVRQPLLVLLGAVGCVLLVACANVANLLLARASSRNDELAVRVALGAGRGRLVRQLVTEALVLGLVGGMLGLLVAYLGTAALVAARPADIPRLDAIKINGPVVIVTLGMSLLTGLIFGIVPAMQATGRLLKGAMRGGKRTGATVSEHRMRSGLVVAEMALAVVLLIGAGLLIRSFAAMTKVSPGFRADQAMTFRVSLQGPSYETGVQLRARANEIEDRLRALPGVTAVGLSTVLPLSGRGALVGFSVDDAPPPPANVNAEIALASVSPGYFPAIGAVVQRGRGFTAQDVAETPRVAMINEAGMRHWFNGLDPTGRFVQVNGVRIAVVGLVADVLQRDPSQPVQPQLFVPYTQRSSRTLRVVVRSAGDAMAQASAIRGALREIDPNLPMLATRPLTDLVADSVARPRFYMSLLALFAGVALALAATGIFGVMSYVVAQRSREIGIRMALGATTSGILRQTLGRSLTLAAFGAVCGVSAAIALGRVIQAQLFSVQVLDPLTIIAVVTTLGGSALLATILPARRASTLDPARILR